MPIYDLTGNKVSFTYPRLVQIVSGSYYDGNGNVLNIGTSSIVISASTSAFATTSSNIFIGNQVISGSLIVTSGITGSLYGTSSWTTNSLTSSYASGSKVFSISSSYALTASYAINGSGGSSLTTGSTYPITSSWSINSISASYFSGSISNAIQADTASYASGSNIFAISSSYALTASYALNSTGGTTLNTGSTYPITSSWSINSITSSYIDAGNITTGRLNNNILPTQMNVTNITASSTAIFQGDYIFNKGYGISYTNTQVTASTSGATTASLYNLTFGNISSSVYMFAIVSGYDTGNRNSILGDIKSTIKYQNGQVALIGPNTLFVNSDTTATFNVLTGSISASLLVYGVTGRSYNWGATISTQTF
jgi:hypothetical protein